MIFSFNEFNYLTLIEKRKKERNETKKKEIWLLTISLKLLVRMKLVVMGKKKLKSCVQIIIIF